MGRIGEVEMTKYLITVTVYAYTLFIHYMSGIDIFQRSVGSGIAYVDSTAAAILALGIISMFESLPYRGEVK